MTNIVSQNFGLREFRCRCKDRGHYKLGTRSEYCGGIAIAHPDLVTMLQKLRNFFGRKITITSGYRCPPYNRRARDGGGVGGAEDSQHMYGLAADIVVDGLVPADVARVADDLGFAGVEVYPDNGFVHVDMRRGDLWRGERFRRMIQSA